MPLQDENVEAVRAAREALIRKYRGLRAWFRHLQERDRQRKARAIPHRRNRKNMSIKKS